MIHSGWEWIHIFWMGWVVDRVTKGAAKCLGIAVPVLCTADLALRKSKMNKWKFQWEMIELTGWFSHAIFYHSLLALEPAPDPSQRDE